MSGQTGKVEEWMVQAVKEWPQPEGDGFYGDSLIGSIAKCYEPEAERVEALVEKVKWVRDDVCCEHCDSGEHCTWCEKLTEALAEYRKGKE